MDGPPKDSYEYQDMKIRVETNKYAIKIRKLVMAKIVKLNTVNNSLHVI